MMQRIKTIIFPNICVSFTLIMLSFCAISVVFNGKNTGLALYVIELFAVLWIISLICIPISEMKFKKAFMYPLAELSVNYVVCILASYCFKWIDFSFISVLVELIIITVLYFNIYFRTKRQIAREAKAINKLLRNRG